MKTALLSLVLSAAGAATTAEAAWRCTPTTTLVTRANGDEATATVVNGKNVISGKFLWDNVDLANVWGALKFIMTETIDYDSGIDKSQNTRKNKVNYIDFYQMTYCNTPETVWWFSTARKPGYGDVTGSDYHGFGQYLTFDGGKCNSDQKYCTYLHGNDTSPRLGPFVGWQNVSEDPRNPTDNAYWYSAPGSCPDLPWTPNTFGSKTAKTDTCRQQFPSGLCGAGKTPDGSTCTYSYTMLGQVNVNNLVGISPQYKDYPAFMASGQKEFVRNTKYEFVEGLPFWEDPLNRTANRARVDALLQHYLNSTLYPLNRPLPGIHDGAAAIKNPPCYCNTPSCNDDTPCKYDDSYLCVPCTDGNNCEKVDASKCKYGLPSTITPVALPANADGQSSGSGKGSSSAGISIVALSAASLPAIFIATAAAMFAF